MRTSRRTTSTPAQEAGSRMPSGQSTTAKPADRSSEPTSPRTWSSSSMTSTVVTKCLRRDAPYRRANAENSSTRSRASGRGVDDPAAVGGRPDDVPGPLALATALVFRDDAPLPCGDAARGVPYVARVHDDVPGARGVGVG